MLDRPAGRMGERMLVGVVALAAWELTRRPRTGASFRRVAALACTWPGAAHVAAIMPTTTTAQRRPLSRRISRCGTVLVPTWVDRTDKPRTLAPAALENASR